MPDDSPMRSPDWFRRGQQISRCVARIWVNGNQGTGFLLPGNWLLTNNHVLPDAATAANLRCKAQFNYEERADGLLPPLWESHFDPSDGFHTSDVNTGDDWTVVKLKRDANAEFGSIPLKRADPINLRPGAEISIIQHPEKGPKKFALSTLSNVPSSPRRLHYRTATAGGSSGSPVFDQNLQVVALHDGRRLQRDPDTAEQFYCNVGIHINALLEGLEKVGVWPHDPRLSQQKPPRLETGTMQPDSPWYIPRDCDAEALEAFDTGARAIAINGARCVGKSSLVSRLAHSIEARRFKPVWVQAKALLADPAPKNLGAVYDRLVDVLQEKFALTLGLPVQRRAGDAQLLDQYLRQLCPRGSEQGICLIIENIDRFARFPQIAHPLFSDMRMIHDNNLHERLRLVLIHTTDLLSQTGPDGSIFAVAHRVDVSDFTLRDLHCLNVKHGCPLGDDDLETMLTLLGGVPALCRHTFNSLSSRRSFEQICREAKSNGGVFRQHLDDLVQTLRQAPAALLAAWHKVCPPASGQLATLDFEQLRALGLVAGATKRDCRPRCELYTCCLSPDHI